jgi:arginine decarboxylase
MPGESFGAKNDPWLSYIHSIAQWGEQFPGFEKELEGAEFKDGQYHIWVLKE